MMPSTSAQRAGRSMAPFLARALLRRPFVKPLALIEAYLAFVLGKGSGTGWDMEAEARVAVLHIPLPDAVVFDVGAHHGEWSRNVLRLLGTDNQCRFFQFEPLEYNQSVLRSLELPRTTIIKAAVSDKSGQATLYSPDAWSPVASLHLRRDSQLQKYAFVEETVDVVTIDETIEKLGLDVVDFMKLDVEGNELAVLHGSLQGVAVAAHQSPDFRVWCRQYQLANLLPRLLGRSDWLRVCHPSHLSWRHSTEGRGVLRRSGVLSRSDQLPRECGLVRPMAQPLRDLRFQALAMFALAFAVRILLLLAAGWSGRVLNNDGTSYGRIAQSLLAGQGFAFAAGDPTAFRPFGYPLLLAAVFTLAGPSVLAVQVAQAAASGLAAVITFSLARRLIDGRGRAAGRHRRGAAPGAALHLRPSGARSRCAVGRDGPAVVCPGDRLDAAAALGLRSRRQPVRRGRNSAPAGAAAAGRAAAPGLFAGHAASHAARPVADRVHGPRRYVGGASRGHARNAARFDAFIPFPTIGGVTFWGANNAVVDGGWVLPSPDNWPDADPPASMRGWPGLTEQQSQARFYQASLAWIREHPGDAAALIPRKLARSWTLSYADESKPAPLPPVVGLANALFGILSVGGIVVVALRYRAALWLLLTPVAAWLVKTVVFYGSARQTVLVLPVLIIFAAAAVIALVDLAARQITTPNTSRRLFLPFQIFRHFLPLPPPSP